MSVEISVKPGSRGRMEGRINGTRVSKSYCGALNHTSDVLASAMRITPRLADVWLHAGTLTLTELEPMNIPSESYFMDTVLTEMRKSNRSRSQITVWDRLLREDKRTFKQLEFMIAFHQARAAVEDVPADTWPICERG